MITLKITMIRPSLDVEFFADPEEYKTTLDEFKSSGKILSDNVAVSDDGLIKTRELSFLDDETHLYWRHNPIINSYIRQRKQYEAERQIITDIEFL